MSATAAGRGQIRALGPAMLAAALLWSVVYGIGIWGGALPGEVLFTLPILGAIGIGVAWPGPLRGVAVGLAAVVGMTVGVAVSGNLDAWTSGETPWFAVLAYGSIATAGQTAGSAIREALDSRRKVPK